MPTVYIDYDASGEMNFFDSSTATTPRSHDFTVPHNTTETFKFHIKDTLEMRGITFSSSDPPPIQWYDPLSGNTLDPPTNMSEPVLSNNEKTFSFDDVNTMPTTVKHHFFLNLLNDGSPVPLRIGGPAGDSVSSGDSVSRGDSRTLRLHSFMEPVDPTIVDVGDQGQDPPEPEGGS